MGEKTKGDFREGGTGIEGAEWKFHWGVGVRDGEFNVDGDGSGFESVWLCGWSRAGSTATAAG